MTSHHAVQNQHPIMQQVVGDYCHVVLPSQSSKKGILFKTHRFQCVMFDLKHAGTLIKV